MSGVEPWATLSRLGRPCMPVSNWVQQHVRLFSNRPAASATQAQVPVGLCCSSVAVPTKNFNLAAMSVGLYYLKAEQLL